MENIIAGGNQESKRKIGIRKETAGPKRVLISKGQKLCLLCEKVRHLRNECFILGNLGKLQESRKRMKQKCGLGEEHMRKSTSTKAQTGSTTEFVRMTHCT